MKKTYLLVLLLGICVSLGAQERQRSFRSKDKNKLMQLSLGFGADFDLMHKGGGGMVNSLTAKKTPYPTIDFRVEHFFSRRWGWFADTKLSLPREYKTDFYSELVKTVEADYYVKTDWWSGTQKPCAGFTMIVGGAYRIENAHWAFYPRVGFGVNSVGIQYTSIELKEKGGNQLYNIRYDLEGGYNLESVDAFVLSAGFSINYKLARKCYFFLNASYVQPVGSTASVEYTKRDLYTNGILEQKTDKTSTVGREMNVSLGVGLPIYFGRRR